MAMPETLHGGSGETVGESPSNGSGPGGPSEVDAGLARYLSQLGRMGEQLKQTSKQIEDSVVGVCDSFQGIASRAQATVARATGFLGNDGQSTSDRQSFEGLIETCSGTLVKILNTTVEAGDVSRRAIERIEEMDLTGGDEVQVGKFRLVFLLGPRSQAEFGGGGGGSFGGGGAGEGGGVGVVDPDLKYLWFGVQDCGEAGDVVLGGEKAPAGV